MKVPVVKIVDMHLIVEHLCIEMSITIMALIIKLKYVIIVGVENVKIKRNNSIILEYEKKMSEKNIWMGGAVASFILLMICVFPYTVQAYLIMGLTSFPICGGIIK
jgi:hypothetical protein